MISFDECAAMLDEIADAMPYALYRELNGGISIVPDIKFHPVARNHDLCILGEYKRDLIGNSIVFYYGSIARVYGNLPRAEFYKKLEHILHHEVRHHNEYLAEILTTKPRLRGCGFLYMGIYSHIARKIT